MPYFRAVAAVFIGSRSQLETGREAKDVAAASKVGGRLLFLTGAMVVGGFALSGAAHADEACTNTASAVGANAIATNDEDTTCSSAEAEATRRRLTPLPRSR